MSVIFIVNPSGQWSVVSEGGGSWLGWGRRCDG